MLEPARTPDPLEHIGLQLRDDRVAAYLRAFPPLAGILPDCVHAIHKIFGELALSLDVMEDPEEEDGRMLYLLISVGSLAVEDAREKLSLFEAEWFFPNWDRINGAFCVDLEFA